jgi:GNAT superfamily N-acetyltransferase
MSLVSLHDKAQIEGFLRRNPFLHIYSIGDLDDFFWSDTVWYALVEGAQIEEIVLLYTRFEIPAMLAITGEPVEKMRNLLGSCLRLLPRRFYAHLSGGLADVLEAAYHIECHGTYYKMALSDSTRLDDVDTSGIERLTGADVGELKELYDASYPGNWFDPRMLETGHYYGMRKEGRLLGVAGVHVYSERYRVAALGNVTTHPEYRGQGIAGAVCAFLCRELLHTVDHIGLNVKADNAAALRSYERLGFTSIAVYEECTLEWKPGS